MSGCPSDEILAAFSAGGLGADEAAGMQRHIDGCSSCQGFPCEPSRGDPTRAITADALPAEPHEEPGRTEAQADADADAAPANAAPAGTAPAIGAPAPVHPMPELNTRRTRAASYRPGAVVGGRYRLERLLGGGGMGTVWAALHLGTDRPVALKILRGDHRSTVAARLRFQREARVLGRIDHPNLVPVRDVFEDGEPPAQVPVLVMDLLEGHSLAERLSDRGRLPLDEVARLVPDALRAIHTAHQSGVVHRDLKPDNLFVVKAGSGGESLRVLDFGIAKLIDDDDPTAIVITGKGEVLGTPPYMAPEQLRGESEIDRRVDVWALGVILYELLSGRRPFTGDRFVQFHQRVTAGTRDPMAVAAPDLPRDVTALVEKMLTVERVHRCPDLAEAIEVLERHAHGRALLESPRRSPRALKMAGVVAVVALLGALAVPRLARDGTATNPGTASMVSAGSTPVEPAILSDGGPGD